MKTDKCMLKCELADAAGVSMRTFSRWLSQNKVQLEALGMKRTAKMVPPKAVKWICEMYGI